MKTENQVVILLVTILHLTSGVASAGKHLDHNEGFAGESTGLITREVQQTVYDYVSDDIWPIGEILPIKRPDLPTNHIAYVEVTFPAQRSYLVVSTGPETGDFRMPVRGEYPSMTQLARDNAQQHGTTCAMYTLLTPELIVCDDVTGMATGTNIPLGGLSSNMSLSDLIAINLQKFERNWQKIKQATSEEWFTFLVMTEKQLHVWNDLSDPWDEKNLEFGGLGNRYPPTVVDLSNGSDVSIALGDPDDFAFMEIISMMDGKKEDQYQSLLCKTVKLCENENSRRVESSLIKVDKHTGLLSVKAKIADTSTLIKAGIDEIDFVVIIHLKGDKVIMRRYSIKATKGEQTSTGGKVRNCSGWIQKHIPCSQSYFPDYNQHKAGQCAVGCGPVAWAMVFGFYDRAGHHSCGRYSSQTRNLFKCSNGGLTGGPSCVAPTTNIPHKYTEKLNDLMGTFCIFQQGATPGWKMDDVQGFINSQVTGATVQLEDCFLTGIYCERTKNWAKGKIDAGWPVVIGYRLGAFSWHYPVATGYRYRRCEKRRLFGWYPVTEYEWYLHMGWGAGTTEWRPMKAYTAWTAEF